MSERKAPALLVKTILWVGCATAIMAQDFILFDASNSGYTQPLSISITGEVAGITGDANKDRAFVRDHAGNITVFEAPNAGLTWAGQGQSINGDGDVIGIFPDITRGSMLRSYVRDHNGNITVFDAPNANYTNAFSINASGDIAGVLVDASKNGQQRGFVRDHNGNFTVFDAPNASSTSAYGINDGVSVVGVFLDMSQNGKQRGFVRSADGAITIFDAPNASYTFAYSINAAGNTAGYFGDTSEKGKKRSFMRDHNGNMTVFDAPNAVFTNGFSINGGDDIAGYFQDESQSNKIRGFVRARNGHFIVFDAPNALNTDPSGINDAGNVTGTFFDSGQRRTRGFVVGIDVVPPVTNATPSPAPNGYGWNNANVTVDLNATDAPGGSGVKQIQFSTFGAQSIPLQTVTGNAASVTISAEGDTTLSYYATDNMGNQETTKTLSVRIDRTPPVISGMPVLGCTLWPPNGKMVQAATVAAADALSGLAPTSFKVTGTSNEPSGPNNPDIVITPNGSGSYVVQLRADRSGSSTGRVYTLNAMASDLAGNVASVASMCTVPHDQGSL